jgi:hypothetical protein
MCDFIRNRYSFYQRLKIFFICLISGFIFSSCEEPDDPMLKFDPSNTSISGKTITSVDIFWDEATIDDFDRYDIYSLLSEIKSKPI